LSDAVLRSATVRGCAERLTVFLERYLPLFYRREQRTNAALIIRGLLSGLERKSCEPIAIQAGLHRKPVQFFVGAGKWDDEAVMSELRRHVRDEIATPEGVVVLDGSAFPKKGTESCGVARQWCGRLGKLDNCQVGVFLAYAAASGYAPLDRRLYLPEDWAADRNRRRKCHVPRAITFQEKWRIALDLLDRSLPGLPHGWITGDDEFGRPAEFRAALRKRQERYILDVPCDTLVRDLERRRPRRVRAGRGRKREVPFVRADRWAADQPESRWERCVVRDGEKGPLAVDAITVAVRTKQDGRLGAEERLIVIRAVGELRTDYALTNAGAEVPVGELVRAQRQRHRIEEMFEAANGEVGLDHYEVRSWIGWHHHMTLAMMALWFLCLERRQTGGKNPGDHRAADPADLHATAAQPAAFAPGDRRPGDARAPAQRGIAHLPLARNHRTIPSPARAT
jgi:SRSO17 transposase